MAYTIDRDPTTRMELQAMVIFALMRRLQLDQVELGPEEAPRQSWAVNVQVSTDGNRVRLTMATGPAAEAVLESRGKPRH